MAQEFDLICRHGAFIMNLYSLLCFGFDLVPFNTIEVLVMQYAPAKKKRMAVDGTIGIYGQVWSV